MTKQKEPITQNIRNRREHGSRFKVMFYVIGSENSKSGSASYSSRQQNQRRGGAVRHFRCTDTVSDEPTNYVSIWSNIIFSCYVCVDIFLTALLYKNGLHPVNVANVNYIRTEKWKIGFNKLDRSCFVITVSAEQLLTAQLIVIE